MLPPELEWFDGETLAWAFGAAALAALLVFGWVWLDRYTEDLKKF